MVLGLEYSGDIQAVFAVEPVKWLDQFTSEDVPVLCVSYQIWKPVILNHDHSIAFTFF